MLALLLTACQQTPKSNNEAQVVNQASEISAILTAAPTVPQQKKVAAKQLPHQHDDV
ncbi:MAG: hypothetical protein GY787_08875 [Alteromonadales bacterium]|nr:hypothetical protein [Alteromonadales bacterium]